MKFSNLSYFYDEETGLYYLNSRYYNPQWGRFISADGEISPVGGCICGNNLFAYCFNNPVAYIDPNGNWTITISINIDVTFWLFGFSIGVGLSFDDKGNIALQSSYSEPSYFETGTAHIGIMDVGFGASFQYTSEDTVFDLEGPASYFGFSAGPGWFLGIDAVASGMEMEDSMRYDGSPNGFQISGGVGIGIDVHLKETYTETIKVFRGGRAK